MDQKTDEEVAQEVLAKLTEGKLKKQADQRESWETEQSAEEREMTKIINALKDKKIRGEI
jgi:hypothetical protein